VACDRFVNWKDKKPTKKEIETVIKDYFNGLATKIDWIPPRFMCWLPGTSRSPFYSTSEMVKLSDDAFYTGPGNNERVIEVYVAKTHIDVITRHGDELTMNIADGIARMFARGYGAKLDMD